LFSFSFNEQNLRKIEHLLQTTKEQEKKPVVIRPKPTTKFLKRRIVLLKLGKLDIFESRLLDMNSTLANIEETVDVEVKVL